MGFSSGLLWLSSYMLTVIPLIVVQYCAAYGHVTDSRLVVLCWLDCRNGCVIYRELHSRAAVIVFISV